MAPGRRLQLRPSIDDMPHSPAKDARKVHRPRPATAAEFERQPQEPFSSPSAPAVTSFLKEFSAAPPWTVKDMARTVNFPEAEAKSAVAMLQAAGYINAASGGRWVTTEQADVVSGAKPPRFTRSSVEKAISALLDRVRAWNAAHRSGINVARVIVFGDYLSDRDRLQAAEIGVEFAHGGEPGAEEHETEQQAIKELKARSAMLNLRVLEAWMLGRVHRVLTHERGARAD